jgi:MFS family permease
LRLRLSALMFLQYAVPGAVWPMYSWRMEQLGFTPDQTAACCATQAVATVLAPLVAGHAADRWIAPERLLAVLALLAGIDLWVLADLYTPAAVFAASLVFWLLLGPTMLLTAAISFSHLPHPENQFGPIRMWGTVGWMAAGWLLGGLLANPAWLSALVGWLRPGRPSCDLGDSFRLGAVLAVVLAAWALRLPHTAPRQSSSGGAAPLAALRLLRGLPFAVYGACILGVSVTWSFASQGMPLLLRQLGMPVDQGAPTLTLAQVTEALTLGLLPLFLLRLGLRGTMLVGLGSWTAALCLLARGRPLWLVVGSQVFNGLYISGFWVAGQVFVNHSAGSGLRASAQSLLTFANGVGMLCGHLLVGWLRDWTRDDLPRVFAVGAAATACLLLLFGAAFRLPAAGQAGAGPSPAGSAHGP